MQKSTESVTTPDFSEEYREAQKTLDKRIPLGVKLGIVAVLIIMLFASFALGKYPVAPDELVKNVAAQITVGVYNLFNDPDIVSTDGLYGKDQPTFENIAEQNLFYPSQSPSDENITDPVETPAVLSFTYGSQKSDGEAVSNTAQAAAASMNTYPLAKVFRGWKADEAGTINAPGWRLVTGVVTVNLQTTHASKIFSGVEDGKFYTPAANWAVAEGIITGVDGKEFQPNTPCDRQTMCVILSRLFKAENPSMDKLNAMPDAEGVAVWATEGVAWALNEGVISGVDVDGTRYIQADTILSRAMAAQVVANSCYSGLF